MRVIGPVGAELKFERDAGVTPIAKLMPKSCPRLRPCPCRFSPRHHVHRLHDDQDPRQPQCQRQRTGSGTARRRELQRETSTSSRSGSMAGLLLRWGMGGLGLGLSSRAGDAGGIRCLSRGRRRGKPDQVHRGRLDHQYDGDFNSRAVSGASRRRNGIDTCATNPMLDKVNLPHKLRCSRPGRGKFGNVLKLQVYPHVMANLVPDKPMRFDKYHDQIPAGFRRCQSLAVGNDNPYLEPQHLL